MIISAVGALKALGVVAHNLTLALRAKGRRITNPRPV